MSQTLSFERRIHVHAFVARLYFAIPILVHHMEHELTAAGFAQPRVLSLTVISFVSIGMILAEYPSGLLADWVGRKWTIILSGFIHALGVLLFLVPESLLAMGAAQILVGIGTAFRNGADSALVHGHLEQRGEAHRYGAALARMRFYNVLGVATGSAAGGSLYAWQPQSVFILTAVAALIGTSALFGLEEPPISGHRRRYVDVLRESLAELRHNRAARGLTILGGVGNPYFVLAFWVTQTYLIDISLPFVWMGLTAASMSILQSLTMPLSGWLSQNPRRLGRVLPVLVLVPASAFVIVALAFRSELAVVGTVSLVLANGCHLLYRNAVNVRLQGMVPNAVRSSVVSVEAGLGAVWYALLFPLAGWLLSRFGLGNGLFAVAALALCLVLPPLTSAARAGALR